ncbi:P pilus assembly protein, chaperone PapD [Limimonas halophila]|uniref:P pilus assembly protein, chaperone PapD n=1 Tax=Limimonas halophila TaxID=1082479 RepID=A0A1G7M729_9PROT|nr:molecular chaperone [Limimonas halophila]SDF57475.1 P pilus assembly protein, chaperone PapD [Limimonas halophila]
MRMRVQAGLLAGLAAVMLTTPVLALKFAPTRLVLSERNRTAVLRIFNSGEEPDRVRFEWQLMRMEPKTGLLKEVPDGEDLPEGIEPSHDFTIYAPRQAVVPPGGRQIIRFMVRPPKDLPPGEYRSHLVVTEEPQQRNVDTGNDDISVTLRTVRQTTLPVIYRQGELSAAVSISDAKLVDRNGTPTLRVTVNREGKRSIYADGEVVWTGPQGEERVLRDLRGLGVYPEVSVRVFNHKLNPPEDIDLSGGTIHYRLFEHTDNNRQGPLLAETEVRVP